MIVVKTPGGPVPWVVLVSQELRDESFVELEQGGEGEVRFPSGRSCVKVVHVPHRLPEQQEPAGLEGEGDGRTRTQLLTRNLRTIASCLKMKLTPSGTSFTSSTLNMAEMGTSSKRSPP